MQDVADHMCISMLIAHVLKLFDRLGQDAVGLRAEASKASSVLVQIGAWSSVRILQHYSQSLMCGLQVAHSSLACARAP